MIRAVAFCPHPPLLVPAVAQGAAPELDELRAACRAAIRRVSRAGLALVVAGSGARSATHGPGARGTFAGYGVPLEVSLGASADAVEDGPPVLPLSLTVGAWLLHDALGPERSASGVEVGAEAPDASSNDALDVLLEQDTAVLLMGDGSARRSTAAPGYLDERADAFDAETARALAAGEPAALSSRSRERPAVARELLVAGDPAWSWIGALNQPSDWAAELLYDAAPYGVGYCVAAWTVRG